MNTTKNGWMAAALVALAVAAAAPSQAFTRGERTTAGTAADEVRTRMTTATALQGKAVTLLPVHGDEDGYLEARLLDAGIQAGLNMVIANDTTDARFKRILKEIGWDEDQKRLETVDPDTIDELGHLLSTQVLLEGRVTKGRRPVETDRKGRPTGFAGEDGQGAVEMEVQLFAYEIRTKRYSWSAILTAVEQPAPLPPPPPPPPPPTNGVAIQKIQPVVTSYPLNVGLEVRSAPGAEREAELLETYAKGRLSSQGFRVGSGKDDDLTLKLEPTCEVFDQAGDYWVYAGELKASLAVHGGSARLLGETSFASRGVRALGEVQAHRNLADDMEAQLSGWMKRTLDADAIGFAAVRIDFTLSQPVETDEEYAAIDELQKGLAGLPGVRSARLVDQDNAAGTVAFKVVYEPELLPTGPWNKLYAEHPELLDYLM